MATKNVTKNKLKLRNAAKSSSNRLHVVPTESGWAVRREGATRSSAVYATKNEALSGASLLKSKSSIVIHDRDGSIELWSGTN